MSQETDLMKYVLEDVRKYDGIRMPLKASFPERLFVRKLAGKKLHPNPDDESIVCSLGRQYGYNAYQLNAQDDDWKEKIIAKAEEIRRREFSDEPTLSNP